MDYYILLIVYNLSISLDILMYHCFVISTPFFSWSCGVFNG